MSTKETLKKIWKFSNQQLPGSPLHEKNLQKLRPGTDFKVDDDKQGFAVNFQAGPDFIMNDFKKIKVCGKGQQVDNNQVPCDVFLRFDQQNKIVGIEIKGDVLSDLYKLNDKQLYKKAAKLPKMILIFIVIYIFYYLISVMFK